MRQMHNKLVQDIESLAGRKVSIKAKAATADLANKCASGGSFSADDELAKMKAELGIMKQTSCHISQHSLPSPGIWGTLFER